MIYQFKNTKIIQLYDFDMKNVTYIKQPALLGGLIIIKTLYEDTDYEIVFNNMNIMFINKYYHNNDNIRKYEICCPCAKNYDELGYIDNKMSYIKNTLIQVAYNEAWFKNTIKQRGMPKMNSISKSILEQLINMSCYKEVTDQDYCNHFKFVIAPYTNAVIRDKYGKKIEYKFEELEKIIKPGMNLKVFVKPQLYIGSGLYYVFKISRIYIL